MLKYAIIKSWMLQSWVDKFKVERVISSKYFLHPARESKLLFFTKDNTWLWRPSFTFAREMSDFTVQFKRRAVEASWQTYFVVFIYVKPVNCMRKLFPQRAPILLVGAPTTSEQLFTNPDIPQVEKKKKFGFQQKELLMEDVSLQDKTSYPPWCYLIYSVL